MYFYANHHKFEIKLKVVQEKLNNKLKIVGYLL